jgi:LEA14-like dessication related protein
MMKKTVAILFLALGTLSACAGSVRDVVTPEVYLAGIEPLDSGLLEQRMRVDLTVVNPNRFAVTVSSLDFVLDVNDSRLASGRTADSVTIPGREERKVAVTARTGVVQIMRQLLRLPGTHELKYKLSGNLELGRFRGKKIPFDFQGELSQEAMFGGAGN